MPGFGYTQAIGMGLGAAGTGLSMYGDYRSGRAMNDSLQKSLGDLEAYGHQNQDYFNQGIKQTGFPVFGQQSQEGQKMYGQGYKGATLAGINVPHQSIQGVQAGVQQSALNHLQAQNAGTMYGYDNYAHQQMLKNMTLANQLGNTNEMSQLAQVPMLANMQQSGQGGQTLAGIGGLISAAGTGVSSIPSSSTPQPSSYGISQWAGSPQASPMYLGMAAPQQQSVFSFQNAQAPFRPWGSQFGY